MYLYVLLDLFILLVLGALWYFHHTHLITTGTMLRYFPLLPTYNVLLSPFSFTDIRTNGHRVAPLTGPLGRAHSSNQFQRNRNAATSFRHSIGVLHHHHRQI